MAELQFIVLLVCYMASRMNALTQAPLWTCMMCIFLCHRLATFLRAPENDPIAFLKLLGTLSPPPMHSDVDACFECSADHPECAVCLGTICASTAAQTLQTATQLHRRTGSSSIGRVRSRPALLGLSLMRNQGLATNKESLVGFWGNATTLPCGHKFHAGCIHDAAVAKLQCPTCRGRLVDVWIDMGPGQKLIYKFGFGGFLTLYVLVYLWWRFV